MKFDAKKIIKKIQTLSDIEKEKIYDFVILEQAKDLSIEAKKLLKFGSKSTKKLQDWNILAEKTLNKSKKFTNGLKSKV